MPAYFVTGTDTDIGKTLVATALLAAARARGVTTLGLKPVAAGCHDSPEGLRNEDALALQSVSTLMPLPYQEVNPVALPAACSPHIAAREAGRRVTVSQLAGYCRYSLSRRAGLTLIEGAGGWRVPLNDRESLSLLARELQLPVILVVGMRLGCLNTALLTTEAILRDGLRLAGWVANEVDPAMAYLDDNIETLTRLLPAPCLGRLPWRPGQDAEAAAAYLDVASLLDAN